MADTINQRLCPDCEGVLDLVTHRPWGPGLCITMTWFECENCNASWTRTMPTRQATVMAVLDQLEENARQEQSAQRGHG